MRIPFWHCQRPIQCIWIIHSRRLWKFWGFSFNGEKSRIIECTVSFFFFSFCLKFTCDESFVKLLLQMENFFPDFKGTSVKVLWRYRFLFFLTIRTYRRWWKKLVIYYYKLRVMFYFSFVLVIFYEMKVYYNSEFIYTLASMIINFFIIFIYWLKI